MSRTEPVSTARPAYMTITRSHIFAHKVMRDENDRQARFLLNLPQETQVLRLNGDIQRRCGLVCNNDARFTGDRHGPDHTLFHATTHLMWVIIDAPFRVRHLNLLQSVNRPCHQRLGPPLTMDTHGFND